MTPRPGPRLGGSVALLLLLLLAPDAGRAQRSVADLLGRPAGFSSRRVLMHPGGPRIVVEAAAITRES